MHSTQSHIISAHHTASGDSTPPRWEMRVKRQHIPAALLWKQLTATPLTEHQWCPGISGPHSENHCSTRKETALKREISLTSSLSRPPEELWPHPGYASLLSPLSPVLPFTLPFLCYGLPWKQRSLPPHPLSPSSDPPPNVHPQSL